MSSFDLETPFDIDNGELSDVPPEKAFVLGVEYELVRRIFTDDGNYHARPIHTRNRERLLRLAIRMGKRLSIERHDDTWSYMIDLDKENEESDDER